jgi:hypothetical protein
MLILTATAEAEQPKRRWIRQTGRKRTQSLAGAKLRKAAGRTSRHEERKGEECLSVAEQGLDVGSAALIATMPASIALTAWEDPTETADARRS